MKRVRWAAPAVHDLNAIRDHFADGGEHVAQHIIDRLTLATDWLLEWPYAGQEIAISGWRRWSPRRAGHVLVYRPVADGIEIGHVRHARENWLSEW